MKTFGPLKNMSCHRFEGKHKDIKENSKVITSRKNAPYTLALKNHLRLCHRLVRNEGFCNKLVYGPILSKLHLVNEFYCFKNILPSTSYYDFNCVNWARISGTFYSIDNVINRSENDCVCFEKIKFILINKSREAYFLCKKIGHLNYDDHYSAFEINETTEWKLIKQESLIDYGNYSIHIKSNLKKYISYNC